MFYQRILPILFTLLLLATPVSARQAPSPFRLERLRLTPNTELLTVFGSFDAAKEDVPLLSVLVETFADDDPANDCLLSLWSHTYAPPDFVRRAASAIPFLHFRGGRLSSEITVSPAPLLDLQSSRSTALRQTLWWLLQSAVLDDQGFAVRTSTRAYRQNAADARRGHIQFVLAVLWALDSVDGTAALQLRQVEARLQLAGGRFGAFIKDDALAELADKRRSKSEAVRGRNWDLLRQRAEAEGLYFEPLAMPDGKVTHAVLWVAREDFDARRKFNGKFLNIKNPFNDRRLREWKGFVETRRLAADNRRVELIPLAVYGLDHPRFPALLADFRDRQNPKWREASGRIINDLARTTLRISPFRNLPLWLGRRAFNFVINRRNADFNQPSRMRAYAQLDLLLATGSIEPGLRQAIAEQVYGHGGSPLQNKAAFAREHYAALLAALRKAKQ